MRAPLQYLLITIKVVALEKVSFIDTQNPKTLTVDEKNYPLNRDNLTQPIQIKLSNKENSFSEICFAFLHSLLNFKHLPEKDDPHS